MIGSRLDVRSAPSIARAAVAQLVDEALAWAAANPRDRGERRDLALLGAVWCKGGPLRRHSPWRHGFARSFGRAAPRVGEFDRLARLHGLGIPCAVPLLAAARYTRARLRVQVLVTAFLPDAVSVDELRDRLGTDARRTLAATAGTALARLHAAGIEHRDAYARNLLVDPADATRWWWVDPWRAARRSDSRGLVVSAAARDVARALTPGASAWSSAERTHFLDAYAATRGADWSTPRGFGASVDRALARELARMERLARRRR